MPRRAAWRSTPLPFYPEVVLPLVTVKSVASALGRFQPSLVHIATAGPLGRAALLACRRLGLHYPTDVLGGAILGGAIGLGVAILVVG